MTVDAGGRDPVTGASFAQLAQLSRSRHRTQGMGRWVEPGPSPWPLHRAWAAPGLPDEESDILDGLPRRVGDLARRIGDGRTADMLYRAQAAIDDALAAFPARAAVAAALVRALAAIREASAALPADAVRQVAHRLARKERELGRALAEAIALQVRLTPRPAVVAAGGRLEVEAVVDDCGALGDEPPTVDLEVPAGWTVTRRDGGFTVAVPADAAPVDAYPARWSPLDGAGPVRGRVRFSVGDQATERVVPTEEPVAVVPAIAVAVEPERIVVNTARPGRPVELNLTGCGARRGRGAGDAGGPAARGLAGRARNGAARPAPGRFAAGARDPEAGGGDRGRARRLGADARRRAGDDRDPHRLRPYRTGGSGARGGSRTAGRRGGAAGGRAGRLCRRRQ